jgi:hypothetical protein
MPTGAERLNLVSVIVEITNGRAVGELQGLLEGHGEIVAAVPRRTASEYAAHWMA